MLSAVRGHGRDRRLADRAADAVTEAKRLSAVARSIVAHHRQCPLLRRRWLRDHCAPACNSGERYAPQVQQIGFIPFVLRLRPVGAAPGVLAATRSDSRCLVERSGFGCLMPSGSDHFLLRDRHCIKEGLHRGFAEAPASLMWPRLVVFADPHDRDRPAARRSNDTPSCGTRHGRTR